MMRAEFQRALLVGVAVAAVGGLIWFPEEPILTRGAVVPSTAFALLALLAWSVIHHEAQQRELRLRLKRIDWGGE